MAPRISRLWSVGGVLSSESAAVASGALWAQAPSIRPNPATRPTDRRQTSPRIDRPPSPRPDPGPVLPANRRAPGNFYETRVRRASALWRRLVLRAAKPYSESRVLFGIMLYKGRPDRTAGLADREKLVLKRVVARHRPPHYRLRPPGGRCRHRA